ncbi:phosphoribosylformylglycinamidine synthase subunit PurL [Thermostichus vulcanus]|uniref:Phosphoribosylformylglycinamidine synthase subunit PurL n=1 Tax=Thermostichus vulcanus str. 'Rupite' TaxID=2813851 RepID=A0ABT0C755_THEVL|nr:phosphoribosylformylglycinamidine synthase subunit PurL [Thermostichus vulcanus]MCJ2541606.1 phosphoribosylformylglycinamidine synthase subunit PurL [Thermostichus vulcanus str. 'Rupite']
MPYTSTELKTHGLSPDEYQMILEQLGRDPNPNELAMFGVMWSEHCCYKNSRPLLKGFPTTGERILVGPGENAGVVDLGDGDRLAFKIESHNHPSAVEPFQGAATGVGGILRDIFTMGARPIALLNSLRFGPLSDPHNRRLLAGVVEGIAHYGNCSGVPTVGGELAVDLCYAGNPLVNVMALGLMETATVVKSGAQGVGNPVLYVGSTTGRDGIRGASFASAELSEHSQQDRPAVQVGDPFLGKCLIEACLEAFQTGAVVAAQDMGAAGITCSTSEMAAKGGVGIRFHLDQVPVRESGMQAWEYLLSESQERMLFVAQQGREQELIEIFHRWGLQASVAGEVLAEPVVEIWHQGSQVVNLPARSLAEDTPLYPRPILSEPPDYAQVAWQWDPNTLPSCDHRGIRLGSKQMDWGQVLLKLLASPNIASKAWVYRQYDHQVQNNTRLWPGQGDAAVIRIRPQAFGPGEVPPLPSSRKGVAATVDGNGRWVYLDPYEGAKAAVAEAARNLSCVGAEPLAVTDNLNFGNPENPVVYWQLALACRGIAEACRALGTPVTGGNVSLYNETRTAAGSQAIYPTPVIGMVGLVADLRYICGQGWQQAGDPIYLLGSTAQTTLGGSEYLAVLYEKVTGRPAAVDLELEKQVQASCRFGIRQGWVRSAHDCSDGGLAVALAEACISGGRGATIQMPNIPCQRWDHLLFGEGSSRILVAIDPLFQEAWETYLDSSLPGGWLRLGQVGTETDPLSLHWNGGDPLFSLSLQEMHSAFQGLFLTPVGP